MFIELDYEQPFLFRDIPVKEYHFKDFDFKAFDFVYQKQRPADYFFSCWFIDSYFDYFNLALYTDFTNSLMHSFVEEEGLKEVLRLDIYNKFKLNNNDLDLFYSFDRQLYMHEFLFLENINSFEDFSLIYEEKFSNVQLNLKKFENFFSNAVFDVSTFSPDFYFSDITKKFSVDQIFLLYQESLLLYDQLAFLFSYDVFFLELFDICQTMNVRDLVFFFW